MLCGGSESGSNHTDKQEDKNDTSSIAEDKIQLLCNDKVFSSTFGKLLVIAPIERNILLQCKQCFFLYRIFLPALRGNERIRTISRMS